MMTSPITCIYDKFYRKSHDILLTKMYDTKMVIPMNYSNAITFFILKEEAFITSIENPTHTQKKLQQFTTVDFRSIHF